MPPNPSPPRFYSAILAALGAPAHTRDRTQTDQREQIALDLLKKVGVQPRDSEQLKLSRIETSDVQPSPAVQHDRATV